MPRTHSREKLSELGVYQEGMPWNPVEKIIMERRSIRRFKKEPLPDTMIQRILEAGRFAPSAGNSQAWKFIVINSPEIIAEMEKDGVRLIKLLMFFLDYTRRKSIGRKLTLFFSKFIIWLRHNEFHPSPFGYLSQIAQDKAPIFHGAPTVILILEDVRGVSRTSSGPGICGQNMVLAAHSLGAGTCWIGLVKLLTYYPKWRKKLGLKFPYTLNESIALGWQYPHADGYVPREVQLVEWYDKGMNDAPKIVRQGE